MATSKENRSPFEVLNTKNVKEHIEQKNGLNYLSWAWAWAEVKKEFPEANYKIYERPDGCFYFTDGKTCWVKTGVTINGLEHIEYLPVMDYKNKSIPLANITSFDVNKAIQRSLTKACARHGLGLYIYAGEDLPEIATNESEAEPQKKPAPKKAQAKIAEPEPVMDPEPIQLPFPIDDEIYICKNCGKPIEGTSKFKAAEIAQATKDQLGDTYCMTCGKDIGKKRKKQEENT